MSQASQLVMFVQTEFSRLADSGKAPAMASYMKTDMPFYGIAKPERLPVYREIKKRFKPISMGDYEESTLALWNLPHREEKYAALYFAGAHGDYIRAKALPLFERLIREGAWWDLVDEIATHLSGRALFKERKLVKPIIDKWIEDDDLWIRRAALLSQIGHKAETDTKQLFEHCLLLAHEKDFFIRKAIGWALRDYSWTNPELVRQFIDSQGQSLSPLSKKEAMKQLPQLE